MYHGKNKTALLSQQLMAEALTQLMDQKAYKDISVSELCQLSGVSRQTFYSLFQTKDNILLYLLQVDNDDRQPGRKKDRLSLMETCQAHSQFVVRHEAELRMLIENDLGHLLDTLIYQSTESCRSCFHQLPEDQVEYALGYMAAGLSQLTRCYLKRNASVKTDELSQIAYQIMGGAYFDN